MDLRDHLRPRILNDELRDMSFQTQGEYRGDVTRDTFHPFDHIRRVILQQGRVSVDADQNEQMDILLHYTQSLARDIGGPHFGRGNAFKVGLRSKPEEKPESLDVPIAKGNYYVQGVLCENAMEISYLKQPDYPDPPALKSNAEYLLYLDVWERNLIALHNPRFREAALGTADSAVRSQVVWQIKAKEMPKADGERETEEAIKNEYDKFPMMPTVANPKEPLTVPLPPRGIIHHYAPLASIILDKEGFIRKGEEDPGLEGLYDLRLTPFSP